MRVMNPSSQAATGDQRNAYGGSMSYSVPVPNRSPASMKFVQSNTYEPSKTATIVGEET
jgi:hypothetical protein